jgi:predicted DNA-binding transcriptional regulator YafY
MSILERCLVVYHPTTRVLTVLELLQSHQRISGPELASRLEVNVRTARRYIMMLQDMGIPIEAERGRYGAYTLRAGFKLPPLMFTEDEALALTLGLLAARQIGLANGAPDVEGALAKVERVLPAALRERVQAIKETLALDIRPAEQAPANDLVVIFSAAAQRRQRVWVRYASSRGEETEREFDSYGVVYQGGRWYAVGYCHLREDLRVFRLDRVLATEPRCETFARPADFDSLDYMQRSFATMPGTWLVRVLLELSLEEARCRVPPSVATLEQTADGVMLRCYTENLDWIARNLVYMDCRFRVIEPPELRETLQRLASKVGELAAQ